MAEVGRRLAAVVAVGLLGAVLAGCSDDDASTPPEGASTQTSFPTSEARAVPDPCAALPAEEVATLVGVDAVEPTPDGAESYRGCSYTDLATDVVVLTTTLYASDADFEAVWQSVVGSIEADTTEVTVPGADGARLITAAQEESLAISGVAAANGVVDQVNLLVPAPYDLAAQTAAVTTVLERLVAQTG